MPTLQDRALEISGARFAGSVDLKTMATQDSQSPALGLDMTAASQLDYTSSRPQTFWAKPSSPEKFPLRLSRDFAYGLACFKRACLYLTPAMRFTKFSRSQAGLRFEYPREVRLMRKACGQSDLDDGLIGT